MRKKIFLLASGLVLFLAACTEPETPSNNQAPSLTNPGTQTSTVGQDVSLQITATDPEDDALSFSATGLPDGLAISNAGLITGAPSTEGNSTVIVTVDDGNDNQAVTNFSWQVFGAGSIVPTFTGSAYSYASLSGGSCSFNIEASNLEVVSINTGQFGLGELCGASIEVTGDKGSKTLLIADELVSDEDNAISMPRATLEEIVTVVEGAKVEWKLTFPENLGTMSYELKDVDPDGFTALLVKNHLTPITSLECRAPGETSEFKTFERNETSSNFFWGPGFGGGPITCRITDSFGATVEEEDIPAPAGASTYDGTQQFPIPTAPAVE